MLKFELSKTPLVWRSMHNKYPENQRWSTGYCYKSKYFENEARYKNVVKRFCQLFLKLFQVGQTKFLLLMSFKYR